MLFWKRLKLKSKIQLFFLPLIIFSIIIILILSVSLIVSNGKKEVIDNSQDKLNLVRDQADKIFENIRYNVKAFSTSSILQSSLNSNYSDDMYGRYLLNSSLHSSVYNIMDVDSFITDGFIHTNQNISYDIKKQESNFSPSIEQKKRYDLIAKGHGKIELEFFSDSLNLSTLQLTKAIIDIDSGNLLGVIEFNLKESLFKEAYEGIKNDVNAIFFLCDLDGRIISASDSTLLGKFLPQPILEQASLNEGGYQKVIDNHQKKIIFSERLKTENFMVVSIIDQNQIYSSIKPLVFLLIGIGFFLIIITIVLSNILARTLVTPLQELMFLTNEVGSGNIDWSLENESEDEIGELSKHFKEMILNIQTLTTEKYQEQEKQKEYELRLVQAQINPHFLYNSLDNISTLIEYERHETALTMIQHLANYYQHVLSKGKNVITFSEEVALTKSYLEIQLIRNPHFFSYEILLEPELADYRCFKLLIQPIVENSIIHGFTQNNSKNKLKINIYSVDTDIIIEVTDNGIGFQKEPSEILEENQQVSTNNHFGLKSIQERIRLKFGATYGISILSQHEGNTIITLKFPMTL